MKPLPMAPTEKVIDPHELDALVEATTKILANERELLEEWEKPLELIECWQPGKRGLDIEGASWYEVGSGILWIEGPMGPSLIYHKPKKASKPKGKCVACGSVHNRKGG